MSDIVLPIIALVVTIFSVILIIKQERKFITRIQGDKEFEYFKEWCEKKK